jgi:hypothetical protein
LCHDPPPPPRRRRPRFGCCRLLLFRCGSYQLYLCFHRAATGLAAACCRLLLFRCG